MCFNAEAGEQQIVISSNTPGIQGYLHVWDLEPAQYSFHYHGVTGFGSVAPRKQLSCSWESLCQQLVWKPEQATPFFFYNIFFVFLRLKAPLTMVCRGPVQEKCVKQKSSANINTSFHRC